MASTTPFRRHTPTGAMTRPHANSVLIVVATFVIGVILGLHITNLGRLKDSNSDFNQPMSLVQQVKLRLGSSGQPPLDPRPISRFLKPKPAPPPGVVAKVNRKLPDVPKGPPTMLYLVHSVSKVDHKLIYDSSKNYVSYTDMSVTETLLVGKETHPLKSKWLAKSRRFRRLLTEKNLNTVDRMGFGDCSFLKNIDMEDIYTDALTSSQEPSERCTCDTRKRPVMDMAVVIPMEFAKYELTWSLLESVRQLTVYPKEIVFVVGNVGQDDHVAFLSFVQLLADHYVPQFPPLTKVTMYTSPDRTKPGENRWFGFNQTTASIVTLFDNDDYMHPQFFHIFWRIFEKRPELDHALMVYEGGAVEGECGEDLFFTPILNFLEKQQFTEAEVSLKESYPHSKYEELWGMIPTFNKTWWLGNTDAEPNWGDKNQEWWDYGCHNGWSTFRRHVMELIPPPVDKYGGEDAIWNWRIGRAKFNYRCIKLVMGCFLKAYCNHG